MIFVWWIDDDLFRLFYTLECKFDFVVAVQYFWNLLYEINPYFEDFFKNGGIKRYQFFKRISYNYIVLY